MLGRPLASVLANFHILAEEGLDPAMGQTWVGVFSTSSFRDSEVPPTGVRPSAVSRDPSDRPDLLGLACPKANGWDHMVTIND